MDIEIAMQMLYRFLERRIEMYNYENLENNEHTRKKEICQNWGTIK